jgi:hypothetical protein
MLADCPGAMGISEMMNPLYDNKSNEFSTSMDTEPNFSFLICDALLHSSIRSTSQRH